MLTFISRLGNIYNVINHPFYTRYLYVYMYEYDKYDTTGAQINTVCDASLAPPGPSLVDTIHPPPSFLSLADPSKQKAKQAKALYR